MLNESKLAGGVPPSKLNWPPNSCMPSIAKIIMNKNNRKSNEIIERMEFSNEITRFRSDDQYAVILKMRSKRNARKTDNPNESVVYDVQMISNNEAAITIQSKRLKADTKYLCGPMA